MRVKKEREISFHRAQGFFEFFTDIPYGVYYVYVYIPIVISNYGNGVPKPVPDLGKSRRSELSDAFSSSVFNHEKGWGWREASGDEKPEGA